MRQRAKRASVVSGSAGDWDVLVGRRWVAARAPAAQGVLHPLVHGLVHDRIADEVADRLLQGLGPPPEQVGDPLVDGGERCAEQEEQGEQPDGRVERRQAAEVGHHRHPSRRTIRFSPLSDSRTRG